MFSFHFLTEIHHSCVILAIVVPYEYNNIIIITTIVFDISTAYFPVLLKKNIQHRLVQSVMIKAS